MTETNTIRHGEIVLQPTTTNISKVAKVAKYYIVGHSETGHHHVLEGKIRVLEEKGRDPIVALFNDTPLVHKKINDKHDTIIVKKGTYKVLRKTEFDPFEGIIKEVQD